VGVLGSTRGSSLVPILSAIAGGDLGGVSVVTVISNVANAGILEKAAAAGIPHHTVLCAGRPKSAHEDEISSLLHSAGVDIVLCCGWMRILSPTFVARWRHRIINVHPSLLPAHAGGMDLEVHAAVLKAKENVSGCTVSSFVGGGPVNSFYHPTALCPTYSPPPSHPFHLLCYYARFMLLLRRLMLASPLYSEPAL